jgi:hypothetical protein
MQMVKAGRCEHLNTSACKSRSSADKPPSSQDAVGLIVLHLVTYLPILGGLAAFLGLAFGLGLIVHSFRRWSRPSASVSAAVPVAVPA